MWGIVAELVRSEEQRRWWVRFGKPRPDNVRLTWHFRVVGHVCVGDVSRYGHLECQRLVIPGWQLVRFKE